MSPRQELMIARLAAAYRQGRLVPFLGAGMSVGACPGWPDFVSGLERQAFGSERGQPATPHDPEALIRRANAAVRQLRLRGNPSLAIAVCHALKLQRSSKAPEQTTAIAKLYWPLVLTSNYDDLFLKAWNRQQAGTGADMEVLGRSAADCRQVLTSLHASRPPILWALQGYVGNVGSLNLRRVFRSLQVDEAKKRHAPRDAASAPTAQDTADFDKAMAADNAAVRAKRLELEQQLVVGHEEYRRVTHTEPQFRRAFAEVFRSRSLLFVGSSLADHYLLNLFGEALEIFGSNPYPHYAFVLKETVDADFLRTRLNTFVYEYADHDELPELLDKLENAVENTSARVRTWTYSVGTPDPSRRDHDKEQEQRTADLHVVRGDVPRPGARECIAVAVSVDETGRIKPETTSKAILERRNCLPLATKLIFGPREKVLRIADNPVFLMAVTRAGARQDLRQYSESIIALLDTVSDEFGLVRTRLPLPDRRTNWVARGARSLLGGVFVPLLKAADFRQRFWLMEAIRAFGRWRRTPGNAGRLALAIHLTDPGILVDMSTGRIDPLELLMCDDLRFTVEIDDDTRTVLAESHHCEGTVTLGAFARALRILPDEPGQAPDEWFVEVEPSPTDSRQIVALADPAAQETSLSELGVVTDCVLRFVRPAAPPPVASNLPGPPPTRPPRG